MSASGFGILCLLTVSLFTFASAQLSEEEQQEILRAHNTYRGQVDPIATNMEEMVRIYSTLFRYVQERLEKYAL